MINRFFIHKLKKRIVRLLGENEKDWYLEVAAIAKEIGEGVRVLGYSTVNSNTIIGNNTVINTLQVIGNSSCQIGSFCHLARGLTIITSNHNYKGNGIPYDETVIEKPVNIGDFVWIGANVTILPGVEIGEGAIIQAGSVVRKNIPALGIAGGNPAEVFSSRDEKHYYQMKSQNLFY